MEKNVKVDGERSVKVVNNEGESFPNKQIIEAFCTDGLKIAQYSMNQGDVFTFSASLDIDLEQETNRKNLVFKIEVDHPLYFAFLHLLNGDKELILNDIREKEENIKYLSIKNEDDVISLDFVDKLRNERLSDKFTIIYDNDFNYLIDKQASIENDKKNRLNNFFEEASTLLFEDCHQISFEEYEVKKKVLDKKRNAS